MIPLKHSYLFRLQDEVEKRIEDGVGGVGGVCRSGEDGEEVRAFVHFVGIGEIMTTTLFIAEPSFPTRRVFGFLCGKMRNGNTRFNAKEKEKIIYKGCKQFVSNFKKWRLET